MKRILATLILTCALCVSALAGEIPTCNPAPASTMGEVPTVGAEFVEGESEAESGVLTIVLLTLVNLIGR